MRVLHINKFLYRRGGAEGYMLDVASLQSKAGHTVGLWGMSHPENDPDLPLAETFAPYVELDPAPAGLAGLHSAAKMVWSPVAARRLEAALARFRPDVVHLHNVYHQLSPSILRPVQSAQVPSVMTLHDYKLACPNYQMLNHSTICDKCVGASAWHAARERCKSDSLGASLLLSLESSIHRAANAYGSIDLLLCPSLFLHDVMVRQGIDSSRLRILHNFADQGVALQRSKNPSRLIYFGRLSPEKGIDTLIRAVAVSRSKVFLDIAGDGPERIQLEALASREIPGQFTFHGRVNKERLTHLLSDSVATVVPSRWNENQPMVVLESFAAGVPVIATSLGGLPELVGHMKEGLVVPPDDASALAKAIDQLFADPQLVRRLGDAGRQKLTDHYGAEDHLTRLVEAYESVSRGKSRQ